VRVNGKRLYEYARQGEKIEIKPRLVNIKNITVIHMDPDKKRVLFDVECSKGTYIRTICHDAGRILGCGAAMSCLIRTASGAFTLDNAVTVEELREGNWERHLLETDFPLVHFGSVTVNRKGKWLQTEECFVRGCDRRKRTRYERCVRRSDMRESSAGHIR
jgi:tRNA pseudouridine55 synthase